MLVDEDTYTANASAIACSKEQFFSSFVNGVQRAMPSRLGQSGDVVLDLPVLHHQIFNVTSGCKRLCLNVQIVILVLRFGRQFSLWDYSSLFRAVLSGAALQGLFKIQGNETYMIYGNHA